MNQHYRSSILAWLGCISLFPLPLSAGESLVLNNEEPAILDIHGTPIGVISSAPRLIMREDEKGSCNVYLGLFPPGVLKIKRDKTLLVRVEGGNDISINCKGEEGIVISRD
jgi:hypothetical protein